MAAGCGAGEGGQAEADGRVTVLGASSLSEALTEIAGRFEAAHPGTAVELSFGASTSLVRQVVDGAPADVLATADEASMQPAVTSGDVRDAVPFARNRLAVVVSAGNPLGIRSLADLARPEVVLVTCAPEVPCGALATKALRSAGVRATPRSLEENAKSVLAKVVLGEADAGLVYATDLKAGGAKVQGFLVASEPLLETTAMIGTIESSPNLSTARAFASFARGPEGRGVIDRLGFGPP